MATHLAQSYDTRLDPDAPPCAVMVPHEKGLFIGYIEGTPRDSFALPIAIALPGARMTVSQLTDEVLPYEPRALITLKTFFDEASLNPVMRDLREKLMTTFEAAYRGEKSAASYAYESNYRPIHEFGNVSAWPESITGDIDSFFRGLQDVAQSRSWRNWQDKSLNKGHIPEKGFFSLIKEHESRSVEIAP